MANYNANAMAAYKQYGQSMIAGGGGSNMSGTGSSTMQVFNAMRDDDDKPSGLAAKPTTTKDKKPSFWDRITSVFQENEVDVTNVYKPSVDPSNVYTQKMFEMVPSASDYVYRAEMSDQTQDMVEQAMGYKKPQLGQLQLLNTKAMSEEEKKRFGPLLDLADDIYNQNISTTELPPIKGEEQSSLMDALMEGQPTAGLMSRPSSFTGGSVQVASNVPNWMQDLSAGELTDALVGIRLGTVDPETGQTIQSAEDVEESNSFTESQPQDSMLGGIFDYIPDAFQVSNYLTGGNQLDGSSLEDMMVDRIVELEGFIPTAKQAFANEKYYTIGYGTYGPQVKKGQTITQAEAETLLREEELPKRVATARRLFDDFDTFSDKLKVELVQGIYRGDFKPTHKTVKLINEGKWTEASKEFLNHAEYKKAKREGKKSDRPGIVPRLEAISAAIYNEQF